MNAAERAGERKKRILRALRGNRLTTSQLCERFGVSKEAMKDTVDALVREGLVKQNGTCGRGVTYEAIEEASKCPPST